MEESIPSRPLRLAELGPPPPGAVGARAPRPPAAETLGAACFAACLFGLIILQKPTIPPARTTPFRVDALRAPWYHLAALDGVGARTAQRWTDVRDALDRAGFRAPPQVWPGMGARTFERIAPDLALSTEDPPR